ncbi:MAG: nickel-dependent hydrogenase large subunit, partial [Spirochaetales bacterium]|nr:nickel-dependent hydrogenase large subunit [Spirochaetales bacterium]
MGETIKIDVNHITRVEGHGDIKIDVENGVVKECKLEIVEAPRFFEAMLKGRHYTDASIITSRICGICSVGHQLASVRATEDAFGIELTKQNRQLKTLLDMGQYFESHVLHVYFLAVPDFVGAKSVFPLIATHKDVVLSALKLKKLGHDIGDMIGGRLVHPISMTAGGFTKMPTVKKLEEILDRIQDARGELLAGVALIKTLKLPDFTRETEYISMYKKGEYAFIDGNIFSSDKGEVSYKDYRKVTNEYLVPHSTAKRAKFSRNSYMVGALARFNNNYEWLSDSAKTVAVDLGIKPICYNPYLNTVAQMIELVHIVDESEKIIKDMLNTGIQDEEPIKPVLKKCTGVGAVEVPRGILFHEYTFDEKGFITEANCVIPTGQNLQNIEDDMKAIVPVALGNRTWEELTLDM